MSGENVRSIYTLRHDEIVELARVRAENNEGSAHSFEPGSAQAIAFERAYTARRMELEEIEA